MRSAYEIIRSAMHQKGITKYRIAETTGDDEGFVGRIINGKRPMPDRLRLVIAEMLDLDPEDIRARLVIERENLDVVKVREAVSEPDEEAERELREILARLPGPERERLLAEIRRSLVLPGGASGAAPVEAEKPARRRAGDPR